MLSLIQELAQWRAMDRPLGTEAHKACARLWWRHFADEDARDFYGALRALLERDERWPTPSDIRYQLAVNRDGRPPKAGPLPTMPDPCPPPAEVDAKFRALFQKRPDDD